MLINYSSCCLNTQANRATIGSAMLSPRFSGLDEERQLSMADEGGTAGAILDAADEQAYPFPSPPPPEKYYYYAKDEKDTRFKPAVLITSSLLAVGIGYVMLKRARPILE